MPRKCASIRFCCVFKKKALCVFKARHSCIVITVTKHMQMDQRCFGTVGPSSKRPTWWEAAHLLKPCFHKHVLEISMQVTCWPRTTLLFWPLVLDFVFWHWSWDRGSTAECWEVCMCAPLSVCLGAGILLFLVEPSCRGIFKTNFA